MSNEFPTRPNRFVYGMCVCVLVLIASLIDHIDLDVASILYLSWCNIYLSNLSDACHLACE